jgi:hypothetical protein
MKKNLTSISVFFIMIIFFLSGCEKDDPKPAPVVSPGKEIVSFKIVNPAVTAVIDTTGKVITLTVPNGTAVTSLTTEISLSQGHTITPSSGAAQNFSQPVAYTVTRPDNTTTVWTVKVEFPNVAVTQDITQSVTWTADRTYVIDNEIEIGNSSVLTIQPGTVIRFGANGSLSIGYSSNATIIANGTAEKPIIFTSSALLPAPGSWEGITFYDKTLNNSVLTYCQVLYAGKNSQYGAVNLLGCELTMKNCTVSNSGSYGVYTTYYNGKGGFVAFENNTINNTAKYGIVMNAQKISSLGTGNVFTDIKGISITGDFRSSTAQTWKNFNVPYVVTSELDIDGNLTIAPGTTFKFDANGWIEIGYYDATTFVADGGSATTPITFTSSAAAPAAGAWKGLVIYENAQTNTKLNCCVIEYAGYTPTNMAALHISGNASITYTNNKLRKSAGYGILCDGDAGFQSFSNNTITDCASHVISMSVKHLPELGVPNTLTASSGKGIEIWGDVKYANPVTWRKQTADFYVKGGEIDIDGILTLEAGSRFLFVNDSYFWFGYYENTKVTAAGTATSKIVFTSASASPVAGTWKGLYFDDYVQVNSSLDNCQFEYTGMSLKPALYVSTSFPVSNATVSNYATGSHPAEYKTGITAPAGAGNNFTWTAN